MSIKIGHVFSKIMKDRRLTLKEVAAATGVPATTLADWQVNSVPRNPTQVRAVAQFLGVSLHFLLFGEEDQEEPIQKIIREDLFHGTFEITVKKVRTP